MFNKRCAKCGQKFTRLGCGKGMFGWIGQILGGLFCFILFGGTSKYCPSCRERIKAANASEENECKEKLDKGFLFRLIWFVVVIAVIAIIGSAA